MRIACIAAALTIFLDSIAGSAVAAPKDVPAKPSANVPDTARGDKMLEAYFAAKTKQLSDSCLAEIQSADDWNARRDEYRRQLCEMLSLDPFPERSPLEPKVTGTLEHDDFIVEKVHFQSLPGLYVTGNLYRPKKVKGTLPAILYVCGHGQEKKNGVSFGNKTHYRHHGAWYARNGYVCLVIDTLQLGEIEGIHHGTHRFDMWWWNARGYTPAGVEAWNGIRALDYLETRPEVDKDRLGVTGRSGGGAYSWYIAALDERVKAAVPVAGITNLQNHVVDGCVEGHCDCMYTVNTYRWDYAKVAALIAPRPLLISNTDKDPIFPLDGVRDVYEKTRRIYELLGAADQIHIEINEGRHVDTPELRVHAFRWFNRFLKGDESEVTMKADTFFTPEELRVFDQLPADERNTKIQESFIPAANVDSPPETREKWHKQRDDWLKQLRKKSFSGWPADDVAELPKVEAAFSAPCGSLLMDAYDFVSEEHVRLRMFVVQNAKLKGENPERIELVVLDDVGWRRFLGTFRISLGLQFQNEEPVTPDISEFTRFRKELESTSKVVAFVAPRGIGMTEWTRDEKERRHIRRRFMLLGQTLDGMRVWDVRRAIQALRSLPQFTNTRVELAGEGEAAGIAIYASLFEPNIVKLNLAKLSPTHRNGPDFLNVLRVLDVPQAVALAAERSAVELHESDPKFWQYATAVSTELGFESNGCGLRKRGQ